MLIATSPRLSSDQEKNKSKEEAYPVEVIRVSSKCNSGISSGKGGDTETYEDHSGHMPTSQSTHMTDCTASKQLKEVYGGQQIEKAKCPMYHNSVKPITIKSDTHHHTTQLKDTQGEEFIYYVQHTKTPSEEPDNALQAAVLTDEICKILQTATVQSEETTSKNLTLQRSDQSSSDELCSLVQMPSVQAELGNLLQTSAAMSENNTDTLQISTVKSDNIYKCLKKATPQSEECFESLISANYKSEEPFKSLQTVTVKSEEPFKSLQTAAVQSEEACSSMQIPPVFLEKPHDCLQTETVYSEEPSNSLWTATDQSKEFSRLLQTSADLPQRLCDFPKTASLQSLDSSNLKEVETFQQEPHKQCAYVRSDHPYHTGQTVSNDSEVLSPPSQEGTIQAKFYHTTESTEEQVDITVNSGKRYSAHCAEPYIIKQTSSVESQQLYVSGTHDGYWSDSVTANKVAVEGDLNG